MTALSGLSRRVDQALRSDARSLHAGDIVVKSYDPISISLEQAIDGLADQERIRRVDVHEFYSVVRAVDKAASVLSRLKVVEPGYPFYGQVTLKSGRPFARVLAPGTCIVEQTLLDRIGAAVGDALKVGYTTLTVVDVVTLEPDRSLEIFSFGPRVFIHGDDLNALGLMATGSRIRRSVLLKVLEPAEIDGIVAQLKSASPAEAERVDTYLTAGSAVKRYLDNFLFFLKLVGLLILMISGLGIQSTLTALFNEKRHTIAIMKAVGAGDRFVSLHFARLTLFLGAVGTGAGFVGGAVVQRLLGYWVAPLLPGGLGWQIDWEAVIEAIGLGFAVVVIFSFLPLYRLQETRPVVIFQRHAVRAASRWPVLVSVAAALAFFLVLVVWHMRDLRFGLYFTGAVAAAVAAAALLAQLTLWAIQRPAVRHLALRQAIKGLFRRGNATRSTMVTLTVALFVIFGITLIERNLDATFVRSFPADAPNLFFVDIQQDQTEAFAAEIDRPVEFYPIVRARVTALNGLAIDHDGRPAQRRDNLLRVFNLTYRERLLDDERLIEGRSLFRDDWDEVQVSVMDTIVEMRPMAVGDRIEFNIQGVPLTARIASIRTREDRSFNPFFYFVFPTQALEKAPQSLFAALTVAPGRVGPLQNRIATRFPNISGIDMSQVIAVFVRLMSRLSKIIQMLSVISVAAGMLILVSAVFATRAERVVESVYYKILGAGKRFVVSVFAIENLIIGLISSTTALLMAQGGAWWICAGRLDIAYHPFPATSSLLIAAATLFTMVVGMGASRSIMSKKPVIYLREQQNG
jgi:putative ABC transport system permease protein